MSGNFICQGQWICTRSRVYDLKNSPFCILLLYLRCKLQWLLNMYGLDVMQNGKTSGMKNGGGR